MSRCWFKHDYEEIKVEQFYDGSFGCQVSYTRFLKQCKQCDKRHVDVVKGHWPDYSLVSRLQAENKQLRQIIEDQRGRKPTPPIAKTRIMEGALSPLVSPSGNPTKQTFVPIDNDSLA